MRKAIIAIFIVLLFLSSCQSGSKIQYSYQQPKELDDGLVSASLESVNINELMLTNAVADIYTGKYGEVHSLLIYRHGNLVFEEYFPGHKYQWEGKNHHGSWVTWNSSMTHSMLSVSKSVTGTCIGIAINQGFIESVHQSIFDYLPEYQYLATGRKEKITIEHLLTMTSGLEWDEWSTPADTAENDIVGIWLCEDPIACVLERDLKNDPGTHFTYSGGNVIVLGEILKNASGMNIDEFSKKYLFSPLGIRTANWSQKFKDGEFEAAGGLEMTPRDMLKIGTLYLNNGVWNDRQIISGDWVMKSSYAFPGNNWINIPGVDSGWNGYAYSWWVDSFFKSFNKLDIFFAGGWGGQKIIVVPELDTVVVFTGGNYTSNEHVFKILHKYIIPAIE
jgi:CubicO group peptidase (beta-lactamase class C family)